MLTLEELKAFPPGKVFATGVLPNNEKGIYMTPTKYGEDLRWVAKKGWGYDDFAIYCHWAFHDANWIMENGDKITTKDNILKCIEMDDEVFKHYRF